jgi:hypothetical protein
VWVRGYEGARARGDQGRQEGARARLQQSQGAKGRGSVTAAKAQRRLGAHLEEELGVRALVQEELGRSGMVRKYRGVQRCVFTLRTGSRPDQRGRRASM